MSADIRNFFGPKVGSVPAKNKPKAPAPTPQAPPEKKKRTEPKKASKKRRIVNDSDDDEEDEEEKPQKVTPDKKPNKSVKKKEEEPDKPSPYFSKSEPKRANRTVPIRQPKPKAVKIETQDDDDEADDIYAEKFQKNEDDYNEESEDEEMDDFINDKEDDLKKPARSTTKASTTRKRKTVPSDGEDDEPPAVKAKQSTTKKTPVKRSRAPAKKKDEPAEESAEIKKIHGSIPTVRAPTPPAMASGKKFDFRAAQNRSESSSNINIELPTGAENCLAGLSFVFTGVLNISRETGQQLVKRFGGKVMSVPSKKTSYVVLGDEAGPKKLETIRKFDLKTINEEGLFYLIRNLPANGGDGNAAKEYAAKMKKEEEKIKEMIAEMDRVEKAKVQGAARKAAAVALPVAPKSEPTSPRSPRVIEKTKAEPPKESTELWTVKYAPNSMAQICGNKGQVEKLQRWLRDWPKNLKIKFVKRGADGTAGARAVMIHGPPGIGKTTAAHLVAKLEGYDILEYNASDTRSKNLMEETMRGVLDNTSLMGYFAPGAERVDAGKKKIVLIMDEVDGMSAGDRGGVGQLAALCKKTSVPIICICNERKLPKMKPFDFATLDIPFRRPDAVMIRSRVALIALREGLKLPGPVIDQLVEGTRADIRQIINMLSTFNTTAKTMTYDESRDMSKAWEKHVILKPWDIAHKLLGYDMFGPNSGKTLNQKMELYFNDHEFSYLMVQENYLKPYPDRVKNEGGKLRKLKLLELADKAASSISDGDLADALIHGPQQHWSLMPTHGMFSTIIPSSCMYGSGGGQMSFTSWLGNNSRQGKLSRLIKEIQSHIRLRTSGDRHEVRQQYLPVFFNKLVRRLQIEGKDSIKDIIDIMDEYYLTRDDWDAILELGVGPMSDETVSIETQTKSAFTRIYNQQSHPMPFMKSSNVAATRAAKKDVPDIEDAIIESEDEVDPNEADKAAADEQDISKDKYVRPAKKKAAPKARAKGKTKDSSEPKAAKAKVKVKASTSKTPSRSKK